MAGKKVIKRRGAAALTENIREANSTEETVQEDAQASLKNMNSTTKAAAVLIALGSESASEVIKHLHDDEIEAISVEIARIKQLSADENDAIINEFYQMCVAQKAITEGGITYASSILNKAFGEKKAGELIFRVTNKVDHSAFAFIKDVDNKNLVMVLQNEHPQVIALVLSHASPAKVSKVISGFSKETQISVIERISSLERANPDIMALVEKLLKRRMYKTGGIENGGINYIAEIMNRIDKTSQNDMFERLDATNPELSGQIRKHMFVFNDIERLNDMEIQAFIRIVDSKDLTIALKTASPEVQTKIFNNMSARQRDSIQADMQYLRNLRVRDVEAAQQRIIDAIKGLEESGDIVLYKDGEDEIIV